jgi:hypothetical protein
VTQTADVEVKRASMKESGSRDAAKGNQRSRVPARINEANPKIKILSGDKNLAMAVFICL